MEKDGEFKEAVRIFARLVILLIPLILKIIWIYLGYKRKLKKRRRIFKKSFKKAGMDKEIMRGLMAELQEIRFRDIVGKFMKNDSFFSYLRF